MFQKIFEANATDPANFDLLEIGNYGAEVRGGVQTKGFWAEMEGATGGETAVLWIAMMIGDSIIGYETATLTATNEDGAYGKVATVAFAKSSTNVLDIIGACAIDRKAWAAGKKNPKPHLRYAIYSGITSPVTGIKVYHSDSSLI